MSDYNLIKDDTTLTLGSKLDLNSGIYLEVENEGVYHSLGLFIDEQQALDLVCHIIKTFHIPNSEIEVIHFPEPCDRAEVLRLAADRIDAGLATGKEKAY